MHAFLYITLAAASVGCVGCKSPGTQTTFKRPYPEVRTAIQTLCGRLQSPSSDWRDPVRLTLSPEPSPRPRAWISGTNEVPDQSYTVGVWDQLASFPTAPHMGIRAVRISPDSTRVSVRSEAASRSSSLVTKRRAQHESETLSQISDILSPQ